MEKIQDFDDVLLNEMKRQTSLGNNQHYRKILN